VAANVQEHGTGALNIDGCRVEPTGEKLGGSHVSTKTEGWDRPWKHDDEHIETRRKEWDEADRKATELGRWPANVIHDGSDEVLAEFDRYGERNGHDKPREEIGSRPGGFGNVGSESGNGAPAGRIVGDTGTAARFFYCAKASRSERGEGNKHPTVKPLALMRYLCRLVTPPGGLILDPFAGSGTTALAALNEGFRCTLIEREPEYLDIAVRRIQAELNRAPLFEPPAAVQKRLPSQ